MNLEQINELIPKFDGEHALLYDRMEDRVLDYVAKSSLPDGYECFLGSFMFFDLDYLLAKKDMIESGIHEPVYDVGSQLGFQSEIFLDNGYVGVEKDSDIYFNEDHPNVSYINQLFPHPEIDLTDKVVISNMSLSFFPQYIHEDEEVARELTVNELIKAKVLYFRGKDDYVEELKKHFKHFSVIMEDYCAKEKGHSKDIRCSKDRNVIWHQYKFWN